MSRRTGLYASCMKLTRTGLAAFAVIVGLSMAACGQGQHQPPAPTAPDSDQAAGLVLHFYRDVAAGGLAGMSDLRGIVSSNFYQSHAATWSTQYGLLENPRLQIRAVHGSSVGYTLNYAYLLNGSRVLSQRNGTWNLVYTNGRWLLDKDSWNAVHVVETRQSTWQHSTVAAIHVNRSEPRIVIAHSGVVSAPHRREPNHANEVSVATVQPHQARATHISHHSTCSEGCHHSLKKRNVGGNP